MTGSVYTKHEPIYELGDGTPMFTFAVKKPQPEVKMECEAPETAGGPRVPPAAKKKQTTTVASVASAKTTSSKLRKAPGGGIVKALDFSGQRTTVAVPPRLRALKVIRAARRAASWRVFDQLEYQRVITDSWPSHLFYMSAVKSASAALQNSVTY